MPTTLADQSFSTKKIRLESPEPPEAESDPGSRRNLSLKQLLGVSPRDDESSQEERARKALVLKIREELSSLQDAAIDWRRHNYSNSLPCKQQVKSVLQFWKDHRQQYPCLSVVACKIFAVRISSGSVERLFSTAALVKTARRNRLGATLFDAIVTMGRNDPVLRAARQKELDKRTLGPWRRREPTVKHTQPS